MSNNHTAPDVACSAGLGRLPRSALQTLRAALLAPAGTRLPIAWHEYRRASNFDRDAGARERLRTAAEDAGFVAYRDGHPWVTEAGHAWATRAA